MTILERVEGGVLELERHQIQPLFARPRTHRARRRIADLREEGKGATVSELAAEMRCAGVVDARQCRMKADDGARLQPIEQREERTRLRFRCRLFPRTERDIARIVRAALVTDRL